MVLNLIEPSDRKKIRSETEIFLVRVKIRNEVPLVIRLVLVAISCK